ncbi:MAG: CPBP family intramembrane metalloprotease [Candidatus Thorarchaeota archaeon]|nr:MAG: CPBP family intramembrane metalloprotease [Candidatus Thorarchaeota archaeon]
MNEDQQMKWLKLILFMGFNFLIILMAPVVSVLFTGELFQLVGTLVFFLTFILMYVVTWAFVIWDGGKNISELGINFDNDTVPHIIIGAIAGVAASVLVLVFALVGGGQLRPVEQITANLIMNQIIITVPTAVFEELVHRGYILTRMEDLTGRRTAIIFSSIFFSLLHFSWWAIPGFPIHLIILFSVNLFLGGVLLSLSYYWSGKRLWVPIAFHFMWNMVAYLTFPQFPREPVILPEIFQIEWGVTTIIGFLFGISLLWGILHSKKKE